MIKGKAEGSDEIRVEEQIAGDLLLKKNWNLCF